MARPNRRKRRTRKNPGRPKAPPANDASIAGVIKDTAACFTCSATVIDDFTYQCDRDIERVECDALYNNLALEMWREHPNAEQLADVIALFAAERQRFLGSLATIRKRLAELTAQTCGLEHVHLDPPEAYRVLVRDRLFPDEPVP